VIINRTRPPALRITLGREEARVATPWIEGGTGRDQPSARQGTMRKEKRQNRVKNHLSRRGHQIAGTIRMGVRVALKRGVQLTYTHWNVKGTEKETREDRVGSLQTKTIRGDERYTASWNEEERARNDPLPVKGVFH